MEDEVNSMSDFHNPDGTMKSPTDICAFWGKAGIHSGRKTAFVLLRHRLARFARLFLCLVNEPGEDQCV